MPIVLHLGAIRSVCRSAPRERRDENGFLGTPRTKRARVPTEERTCSYFSWYLIGIFHEHETIYKWQKCRRTREDFCA